MGQKYLDNILIYVRHLKSRSLFLRMVDDNHLPSRSVSSGAWQSQTSNIFATFFYGKRQNVMVMRGKIKAEKCNFFEFSSRVMLGLFENSVDSHQHSAPLLPYPLTTKRKTMEFIVCFTFCLYMGKKHVPSLLCCDTKSDAFYHKKVFDN